MFGSYSEHIERNLNRATPNDHGAGGRRKSHEGGKRSRSSLRDKIKVEWSFVLNVIAEAPLASLEDRGVSTSKPVLG